MAACASLRVCWWCWCWCCCCCWWWCCWWYSYEEVEGFLATPASELLASGLPLKIGFLFHGPPGTGKTHLVRHLAAKYGLDINIIDMNGGEMNNESLLQCFNMAAGIILLEDIDNVDAAIGVKSTEDKSQKHKVAIDELTQCRSVPLSATQCHSVKQGVPLSEGMAAPQ